MELPVAGPRRWGQRQRMLGLLDRFLYDMLLAHPSILAGPDPHPGQRELELAQPSAGGTLTIATTD